MYSDLFDQLGAAGGSSSSAARGGRESRTAQAPPPVVSCFAGRMTLTTAHTSGTADTATTDAALQFVCAPDTQRGEIRLVHQDGALHWQWYNRRESTVVDTFAITADANGGTFERVPLTDKAHELDRVYVWTRPNQVEHAEKYKMYWMQNASDEKEDEVVAQINQYLADPASAAPAEPAAAATSGSGGTATAAAASGTSSSNNNNNNQVDALSTILENLGMPQTNGASTSSSDTPQGTLTLADLQGAMAGMQPAQSQQEQLVPLSEVVTPASITQFLEQADDAAKQRLLELLPPEQRTMEQLEENLRSPQVQQTWRSLTQALLPDDAGNMEGFYSVLANFQLDANSNAVSSQVMTNPIQAFLEALLASVQSEGGDDANAATEEGKTEEEKDADGDATMQ